MDTLDVIKALVQRLENATTYKGDESSEGADKIQDKALIHHVRMWCLKQGRVV